MTVSTFIVPPCTNRTVGTRVADLLSVTRIHAGCWFALLGLLGSTTATGVTWTARTQIAGYAIALSCLGFTVNNIADRDRDARNPRRRRAPIVAGRITVHGALVIAMTAQLAALGVVLLSPVSTGCRALAIALSFLMIVGNAYQKALGRSALAADILFGCGMGLEVILGQLWVAGDARPGLLLALAAGVQMTLLNVTAGNLKDLSADLDCPQTTTTAIALGVRTSATGGLLLSRRYRALVSLLQLCCLGLVAVVGLAGTESGWTAGRVWLDVLGGLVALAATAGIYRLLSGRHQQSRRGRDWYLFLNFAALSLAYAADKPEGSRLLVGAMFAGALTWEAGWLQFSAFLSAGVPDVSIPRSIP